MIPESHQESVYILSSRPVFCSLSSSVLSFALDTQMAEVVDMGKLKNSIFNTLHTKRINMITTKDNHHITCSNDGSVKIWDSRNNQMISTFKKHQEFYSAIISDDLLLAGGNGSVTIWDVRNNKEMRVIAQSFNGDVTDLKIQGKKLHGCSTDGMVAMFDLNIEDEEESTEWTHLIGHPAQSLSLKGDYTILNTTDNVVIVLEEQKLVTKVQPNSPEEPRHLLWSRYTDRINYYVWNSNKQVVQKWKDSSLLLSSSTVKDIDFLEEVEGRVLGVSSEGKIFSMHLSEDKSLPQYVTNEDEMEEEIVKPKYGKAVGKHKYNPV